MRNFIDTDADGIRDTQSVAIVNFGGGNTTFNNDATGAMRMTAIPLDAIIDPTNAITVSGAASFNDAGILQGQVVGLAQFNNSGMIEMSNNSLAGDVIVITGNSTAGTYGGGNYTANAGSSLHLDTLINKGGAEGLSDILMLDDATLGSGATQVYINPVAGGVGGITQDEGIKIIEGLGTQQAGTFALGQEVSYGAYDYLLGQGKGANANNWYLRNNLNGKLFYTPTVGAYMGNQHAASNMFNHNILDRRDNVRSPDQTIWGRVNYSDLKTDLFGGAAETSIDTSLTQFGVDILKRNDWIAGAYIGYGQSNVDNKSTITNVSATGKVKGYQVGLYGSWMPQENKGPYLDFWGHYARYSSDINGATAKGSYDSTGYALSIEGGYAFELMRAENGKAWILEPHAQLIYNRLSADDFTSGNTRYHGNDSSGIQTRLGARFYMQRANGSDGVVPFVEANWLGNYASNKVKANNDRVSADIGKNVGELKLGAQGKITDGLSIWGHLGGQAGSDSYKRYEVQLGLGYQW
ncbi:MAG: autotransporter outer membrane beta-barrel domain-containing protein [Saezia sp.]